MKVKKNLFPITLGLVLILPTLLIISENFGRGIFIILSILLWVCFCIYTKKYIFSSLLYILFVLPFNITFQLPISVEIFNTTVLNLQPFVEGLYSNYLIPAVSILDLGIFLLLGSFLYIKGLKGMVKSLERLRIPLLIVLVSFFVLNVYHWNFLVLFTSIRFFLGILSVSLLVNWLVKTRKSIDLRFILVILIVNILFQGVLGVLQFNGGSSLGLTLLGESQVVNGMQGSSFISLKDGIYLRAYGTFPHPNVLGGYLLMCFSILWLSRAFLKKYWRYPVYFGILLCVIFSLFTFSRITILLMGVGLIFFGISEIKWERIRQEISKKSKLRSFSFGLLMERFLNLLTGGDTSWNDRWNLMLSSFEVIKKNFLFGSGLGNFVKGMEGFVPRTSNGILLIQPVHNVLLLCFSELGLVGFIPFVYWLFEYFRSFVNWKRNIWIKIFVLTIFVIVGGFDHFLFSLPQGIVMSGVLLLLLSF